jgi:RNAse (barnase) inhibitor barstar
MLSKQLENVQWQCIHFASKEDVGDIDDSVSIDIEENETKESLLDKLANAFEFPNYFGRNWDATHDCLKDLSWLPKERYILVVNNASQLLSDNQELIGNLIEIWLSSAELWSKEQKPFHLVFVIGDTNV